MEAIDETILAELREMGWLTAPQIALSLGLPPNSVRTRLRSLMARGIVEKDAYQHNPVVWGLTERDEVGNEATPA